MQALITYTCTKTDYQLCCSVMCRSMRLLHIRSFVYFLLKVVGNSDLRTFRPRCCAPVVSCQLSCQMLCRGDVSR